MLVQKIIFGSGGQVFRSADYVGNAHGMVIYHIGKVVGRHTVGFDEHLIVQRIIIYGDQAVYFIVKRSGSSVGIFCRMT